MANTIGEKELRRDWPIEEGLTLGTNKLPKKPNLVPEKRLTRTNQRVLL
jgi:hypothetical protein